MFVETGDRQSYVLLIKAICFDNIVAAVLLLNGARARARAGTIGSFSILMNNSVLTARSRTLIRISGPLESWSVGRAGLSGESESCFRDEEGKRTLLPKSADITARVPFYNSRARQ